MAQINQPIMRPHENVSDTTSHTFLTGAILFANLDYSGPAAYAVKAAIGGAIWIILFNVCLTILRRCHYNPPADWIFEAISLGLRPKLKTVKFDVTKIQNFHLSFNQLSF